MDNKGIKDLDKKLKVLGSLLKSASLVDTINQLYIIASKEKETRTECIHVSGADKIYGSLKSWKGNDSSDPTGTAGKSFLLCVSHYLNSLGLQNQITSEFVWKCNIDSFIQVLPKNLIKKEFNYEGVEEEEKINEDYIAIYTTKEKKFDSIEMHYKRGIIDQKICYLAPDSAELWNEVRTDNTYNLYSHCQSALVNFLQSEHWISFCQKSLPDGAVAFGAGSDTKDLLIIESLLENTPSKTNLNSYTLLDYSHYMLVKTKIAICKHIDDLTNAYNKNICITALNQDFLEITPNTLVRRTGTPIAFFITGNTIGNIDEHQFLSSVARVSEHGDLLAIGTETIPHKTSGEDRAEHLIYCDELEKKYSTWKIKRFLRPSLSSVWRYVSYPQGFEQALSNVTVDLKSDEHNVYSRVDGSLTVTLSVKDKKRDLVLAFSTRYDEMNFIEFAKRLGFKWVTSVPSDQNKNYKYLIFNYAGDS